MRRRRLATVVILTLCTGYCFSQVDISGRVVDLGGHPIAEATVIIFPLEVPAQRKLPTAMTDDQGRYHLTAPQYGRVRISAYKTAEGYPDTQALVFANGDEQFTELRLTADSKFPDTVIRLGEPDGLISGIVRDSRNGGVVAQARITLRRFDAPDVMYSSYLDSDGSFVFSLPWRATTIAISAPGYETWTYYDRHTNNAFALLKPGDSEKVEVELEHMSH
jgi:hypothetical protein